MRERYSSNHADDAKILKNLKKSLFHSVSAIVPMLASLRRIKKCNHFVQRILTIHSVCFANAYFRSVFVIVSV